MDSVKIQYISDIHLEVRPSKFKHILTPCADVLILAGDIGHPFRRTYEQFLNWCSLKFKNVILIPGNHEYYGSSLKKGKKRLKRLCKKYNISLLDRDVLEFPEFVILGTTLWSNIPEKYSFDVLFTVNDYKCIEDISLNVVNELYQRNRKWLAEKIKFYKSLDKNLKIIVVTHHAPVENKTSAPKYRGNNTICAYSSDCTDLFDGVDYWIYGHTHYNATFKVGNTIITSNQRGYPKEHLNYMKDGFILLPL